MSSSAKLRFMKPHEFDEEAALLLAQYQQKSGPLNGPPVPVDDIVELHLGLRLEFNDMQKLFGVRDIHGALWVNERRVGIDSRLDPERNPSMLGRYRFTLAHEAGHWQLHRHLFKRWANQLSLLPEDAERPEYICRSSDNDPLEFQANSFASCLLMPKHMVLQAWQAAHGSLDPVFLEDLRSSVLAVNCDGSDGELFESVALPLAEKFEVSGEAMRIRLEVLGLLKRKKEATLF